MKTTLTLLTALLLGPALVSAQSAKTEGKLPAYPGLSANEAFEHSILGREVAWLKMAGWDNYIIPGDTHLKYRYLEEPLPRKPFTTLPLPKLTALPVMDGNITDPVWAQASVGSILLTLAERFEEGPIMTIRVSAYQTETHLVVAMSADLPVFNRANGAIILRAYAGKHALEITAEKGAFVAINYRTDLILNRMDTTMRQRLTHLRNQSEPMPVEVSLSADARSFEAAIPFSCFPRGLNDGISIWPDLFGIYSRVSPGPTNSPHKAKPGWLHHSKRVHFVPDTIALIEEPPVPGEALSISVLNPGASPVTIRLGSGEDSESFVLTPGTEKRLTGGTQGPVGREWCATLHHGKQAYAFNLLDYDPLPAARADFENLIALREKQGRDVAVARAELERLRSAPAQGRTTLREILVAKRSLFFTDCALETLSRVLFVKRRPLHPSHNYTEYVDAPAHPGGAICVLETPFRDGKLLTGKSTVTTLFDAGQGFVRTPNTDYDARKIYFSHLPPDPAKGMNLRTSHGFFHIMSMKADGSDLRQITDGRWNDVYPTPLPDGGVAFISSRIKCRFLCHLSIALTLHRMQPDGSDIRVLSPNNLSEWAPSVMRDGRIAWTRSEYQDKPANWGHTAWAIRPDGTHPELIFGNNTTGGYADIHEMPGGGEFVCTLVSHYGDLNGPIALIRPDHGRYDPKSVLNITPDIETATGGEEPSQIMEAFREPYPVSRDYILCSHAPVGRFGLYLIDRHGNREILHMDTELGSMGPRLLLARPKPPVLPSTINPVLAERDSGVMVVQDVYEGLDNKVERGEAKYIAVFEEVKSPLRLEDDGNYRQRYVGNIAPAQYASWYATPIFRIGPKGGGAAKWPTYIAKTLHGLVPVNPDGSASFEAPAGTMIYFSWMDENYNELQRMRSVMSMQPGEARSCIGCHEDRNAAPMPKASMALRQSPRPLEPPPWGAKPFSYPEQIQPILDRHCISCHTGSGDAKLDLRGTLDAYAIPSSYKNLINSGAVSYFSTQFALTHYRADPKTFGALKSKLGKVLDEGHKKVALSRDEILAIKTWIAMNCPLWGDYRPIEERIEEMNKEKEKAQ